MSYHIGLQVLRAKLRGFYAAGTSISARISKSEKDRKHRLWERKRQLGSHARHHLIAYCLLRGVAYADIEKCAPENKPNAKTVLDIMLAHADWQQARDLDLKRVENLLTTTSSGTQPTPSSSPPSPGPSKSPLAAPERAA